MAADTVDEIRAFNRFYTRQIGVLDEHYANSRFNLSEGRLLYELSERGHATGAELARVLGVDPAYISRMLQKLLRDELLILTPNLGDRRSNQIALSRGGDAAFESLNRATDVAVEAMVTTLDAAQQATLVAAMRVVRRLLETDESRSPVVLRPQRVGELGWLIHRQGLLYNQQFGWNAEFEALIARIYSEYQAAPVKPPKALWVAERDGAIVGSVFVVPSEGRPGTAQLRMLYVEPADRGMGLGRTLVDQVVSFSRDHGYAKVRLWTQSILVAARRIYSAAGFEKVDEDAHHSFGKDLIGEHWELML